APSGQIAHASNSDFDVILRYDSLGRMIEEASNGASAKATYDDCGNRTDLLYPGGRALKAEWSAGNQLLTVRQTARGANYPGDLAAPAGRTMASILRVGAKVTSVSLGPARVV